MTLRSRAIIALLFGYPLLFAVLGLVRAWPFVDDVPLLVAPQDDWESYKLYAHSILREGFGIPVVQGQYGSQALTGVPRAFLYNYFLAGLFLVFGESSAPVYVVQSALLGLSITLLGLALRRRITGGALLAFLVAAGAFAYADFFRILTFRLLSENLYLPLLAAFLLLLLSARDERSASKAAIAGLLLGALVLTRPAALGAAAATLFLWAFLEARATPRRLRVPAIALLACALTISLLPVRDLAVSGTMGIEILTSREGVLDAPSDRAGLPESLVRRGLFTLGFANAMIEEYRPRPQWVLPWLGLLGYVSLRRTRERAPPPWVMLWAMFLAAYVLPATFVGPVHGYGGRSVSIALPLVIPFGAIWIDELRRSWARGAPAGTPHAGRAPST